LLITLDRPSKRNALDPALAGALASAVSKADASAHAAIVITGAPPAFCSGGDLPALVQIVEEGGADAVRDTIYTCFHGLARAIRYSELPVIAVVNGAAIGAGLDLALNCDFRIVARGARLASSWVKLGLVPGMGGAMLLPGLIGSGRAAEVAILGDSFDADEAQAWGLAHEVVEPDDLMPAASRWVARLAQIPAAGRAANKAALRRISDDAFEAELERLGHIQAQLLSSEAFRERARAVLEGEAKRRGGSQPLEKP
jgi:enoyl-CoA hydratase/carnithine racemase